MESNNLIYFGFGYNGLGQLKDDSSRCIYEPHLFLKSKNLIKICLSWNSISWIEGIKMLLQTFIYIIQLLFSM